MYGHIKVISCCCRSNSVVVTFRQMSHYNNEDNVFYKMSSRVASVFVVSPSVDIFSHCFSLFSAVKILHYYQLTFHVLITFCEYFILLCLFAI